MAAPLTRRAVAPNYRATASKKINRHLGHWPSTTEKLCPDAGLKNTPTQSSSGLCKLKLETPKQSYEALPGKETESAHRVDPKTRAPLPPTHR